ncbi:MAG: hypothetical protein ACI9P8_000581 [Bacteroidia bacterium]|jgi:hypothetical protein
MQLHLIIRWRPAAEYAYQMIIATLSPMEMVVWPISDARLLQFISIMMI